MEKEVKKLIKQMKKGLVKNNSWSLLDSLYIDEEALLVSDGFFMFVLFHNLDIKEPMAILKITKKEEKQLDLDIVEYSSLFDSYIMKHTRKDIVKLKEFYNKFRSIENYKKISNKGNREDFEMALRKIQSEFPCNFKIDVLKRAKEVTAGFEFDEFSYIDNSNPVVIRHKPFGCDVHLWEALLILQPQVYTEI